MNWLRRMFASKSGVRADDVRRAVNAGQLIMVDFAYDPPKMVGIPTWENALRLTAMLCDRKGSEMDKRKKVELKTDDPVEVRLSGEDWQRAHFSHWEDDGAPVTFWNGQTSFTSGDSNTTSWDEIRLPGRVASGEVRIKGWQQQEVSVGSNGTVNAGYRRSE